MNAFPMDRQYALFVVMDDSGSRDDDGALKARDDDDARMDPPTGNVGSGSCDSSARRRTYRTEHPACGWDAKTACCRVQQDYILLYGPSLS